MTLCFNLTEKDALAFNERYLQRSPTHQKLRKRMRLIPPVIFLALGGIQSWQGRASFIPLIFFGCLAIAWWFFYGKRFDSRIRAHTKKYMQEHSYARNFGPCELRLLDEHLSSISALGISTFSWSAVETVEIHGGYLYIFLSGPLGYPIEVSQIGMETARQAQDLVAKKIAASRCAAIGPPPLPASAA